MRISWTAFFSAWFGALLGAASVHLVGTSTSTSNAQDPAENAGASNFEHRLDERLARIDRALLRLQAEPREANPEDELRGKAPTASVASPDQAPERPMTALRVRGDAPSGPVDSRALDEASALIGQAIHVGLWSVQDRDKLRRVLPRLGAQAHRLRMELVQALNSRKLTAAPDMDGPPF